MHTRAPLMRSRACCVAESRCWRLAAPGHRRPLSTRSIAEAQSAAAAGDAPASSSGSSGNGGDRQQQQAPWEAPPIPDHVLERNARLRVSLGLLQLDMSHLHE